MKKGYKMKKSEVWLLIGIIILFVIFFLGIFTFSYGATVTDSNRGTAGYILLNNGTGQGHQGTWTDIKTVKELKGEKGDKGDTGATGAQGTAGKDGKDVDPATVTNLQLADSALQSNIDTESTARVSAIDKEISSRTSADTQLQNNINSVNSRVNDVDHRVSKLEKTQYTITNDVRSFDMKKWAGYISVRYNVGRQIMDEVGVKFTYKMGTSYEEREIIKTNARLSRIEKLLGNGSAPVIEKVVDEKGNLKSIHITETGFSINKEF
jgi:hypothetical protein